MAKLKEEAKAYTPQQTKNIADLGEVPIDIDVKEETYKDDEQKEFTIKVIEVNKEKYRVPVSVIKQLKVLLEDNPNITKFKVKKSGIGLNTEYVVIPILKQ